MLDDHIKRASPESQPNAPPRALIDLAARIKQEHAATAISLQRGVEHALVCGDLLLQAKHHPDIEHGQWLPWLAEHCEMSERTAQRYMRLAKHREVIEAKTTNLADLNLTEVAAVLSPPARLTAGQTGEIAIADIVVGERLRPLNPEFVERLAQSIRDLGFMINAIVVRPRGEHDYWLGRGLINAQPKPD